MLRTDHPFVQKSKGVYVMGMTVSEKILARAASRDSVRPGDFLDARVDMVASMDLQSKLMLTTFKQLGASRPWDPARAVVAFDHEAPANTVQHAEIQRDIRALVQEIGVGHFYDVGQGILHQLIPEKGHILPGELGVATESHTPTSGAVGALVIGVGQTDGAVALATGTLWFMVPETIRVDVEGAFQPGVGAKDLALEMMGQLRYEDRAVYKAIEIGGGGLKVIDMDGRFTLTNFCSDMGAKAAIVEPDEVTEAFVRPRARRPYTPLHSDRDCQYSERIGVDLSRLRPMAACPHKLDLIRPVEELAGVEIHQAVLGSCTNGRLNDFRVAAEILRGKKIHPRVRFIAFPASQEVYMKAIENGYIRTLVEAGATILPPGCGCCYGGHSGLLGAGEVCVSTTNRNMKGRMGSKDAQVYLASPQTVAASAVAGVITDPRTILAAKGKCQRRCKQ